MWPRLFTSGGRWEADGDTVTRTLVLNFVPEIAAQGVTVHAMSSLMDRIKKLFGRGKKA